jgi:Ni,Fe-hydrogenase III large subunit
VPATPAASAEIWLGRVEAPRGELVYLVWPGRPGGAPWVRVRTASQVNWAAVPPAVSAGGVLQDVPIIEASFGLSVAAFDR